MLINFFKFFTIILFIETACANQVSDKVKKLISLSDKNGVAAITDSNYKSLVFGKKKNYTLLLFFTISEEECQFCGIVSNAFHEVAINWRKSKNYDSSLFFGMAKYREGADRVFQHFAIQSVPQTFLFMPDGSSQLVPIEKYGREAEGFAKFVEMNTKIKIKIVVPINYIPIALLAGIVFLFFLLIRLGLISFELISYALSNTLSVLTIIFIIAMTSGFMWNHMRGASLWHQHNGKYQYIDSWHDSQLVSESVIILSINLMVTGGLVMMTKAKEGSWIKRFSCACVGMVITIGFCYTLRNIFASKYRGYPESLIVF